MFIYVIESLTNQGMMKVKADSVKDLLRKVGHNNFIILAKV